MKGKFYIDGKDAYSVYGLFVANNGYNGLISFPGFKELDENVWPEYDGVEVDLSSPVLNAMEFSITFYCCDYFKTADFISLISDGAFHEYNFVEAGCVRRLRLVSNPGKKYTGISKRFPCPSPMISRWKDILMQSRYLTVEYLLKKAMRLMGNHYPITGFSYWTVPIRK